jgi:hypothetical protein
MQRNGVIIVTRNSVPSAVENMVIAVALVSIPAPYYVISGIII